MKWSCCYLKKYLKKCWNLFIKNVEEIINDLDLWEHKNIVKILRKNNNKINFIEISPSYYYDLNGSKYNANNIFKLFNNSSFMKPNTIILDGFIFFSSFQFITLIDTISGCKNIIFRDCTIHTNEDLMLKEDNGLDLGILIELRGWIYSKFSEFKLNKVIKNNYICKKFIVKKSTKREIRNKYLKILSELKIFQSYYCF